MSLLVRTLKGSLGFFVANVVARGSGFLFIVVAGRLLDVRSFGLLTLALTITSLGQKTFVFGIPNTVQRFLSGDADAGVLRMYGSTIVATSALALLGTAGLYVSAPWVADRFIGDADLAAPLEILALTVGLGIVFTVAKAVLQSRERVAAYAQVDASFGVLKVTLALAFLTAIAATPEVGAWAIVGAYVGALAVFGVRIRGLHLRPRFDDLRDSTRRLLGYSAPLLVVGLGYYVAQQADRLMLGALDSAESVGLYTAASTLAMALTMVHQAFGRIFMPILSDTYVHGDLDEACTMYRIASKWVAVINGAGFLLFAAFGSTLLAILGPEFGAPVVHDTLVVLGVLYFVGTGIGPTGAFLQMTDGHRHEAFNTVLFVITNVGLNYLCIQAFGLIGAALATTASGLLRNGLQVVQLIRLHGFNPVSTRQLRLLVVILAGGAGLWIGGFSAAQDAGILAGLAALLAVLALRNVTDEERDLVARLKRRLSSA